MKTIALYRKNNILNWVARCTRGGLPSPFSSRLSTKLIFHVDVDTNPYHDCPNWDLTTIVLKKALDKLVRNNQKVIEVGTGPIALLATYIAKKRDISITAVDINPAFIENAEKNVKRNGVSVNLMQSDLFSNVNGLFDIVFFNPPYVPTQWMVRYQKEEKAYRDPVFDLVWNGGSDGCDTIERFLRDVTRVTYQDSMILLGVNTFFINIPRVEELINKNNLSLASMVSCTGSPSKVYVIQKRE